MEQPVLLNPLRRELVELPLVPPLYKFEHAAYGIGFDFKSKVHKVVRISSQRALVLTLGTKLDSWRDVSSSISKNRSMYQHTLVNTRGYVHWLSYLDFVFSFDIEKKEFMLTPYPRETMSCYRRSYLTCWKQSLALVHNRLPENRNVDKDDVEIWIMKDLKTKEWIRAFRTPIGPPAHFLRGVWKDGFLFHLTGQGDSYTLYKPNNIHTIEYLDASPAVRSGKLYLFTPNLTSFASYGCLVIEKGISFDT